MTSNQIFYIILDLISLASWVILLCETRYRCSRIFYCVKEFIFGLIDIIGLCRSDTDVWEDPVGNCAYKIIHVVFRSSIISPYRSDRPVLCMAIK